MTEWEFIKIVVLPGLGASFGLTLLVWREARKGRKDIWAFITNHMTGLNKRVSALEREKDGE
jgi:hypothetical protein